MSSSGDVPSLPTADLFGAYFVGDITVPEALRGWCDAAITVAPANYAAITLTIESRPGTYGFSHPEVAEVEHAQYAEGDDGPAIAALHTGQPVLVDSMRAGPGPYASFRTVAARHGIGSAVCLPMSTTTQIVGALNLYAVDERAFTWTTAHDVRGFAQRAAYSLLNHQAYWDVRSLSEGLGQALESRAVIEQAKGIIMASSGCTPADAFERLKQQSQHQNAKLRDVADEIVRHAQRRNRPS